MQRPAPWPRPMLALAAGAIALRLLLLLGRGDYLAFDEGWYLLLARSLYTGGGYSLIGIPHVTLSPLFPVLAGAMGVALDSWVWGGRVVAALASGLLVLPVWSVFRRLGSDRIAFITALLVAVLPSMAPFVVPFWIGADLWVGAEPLLHLLLFTGIALWLRAEEEDSLPLWGLTGAAFGLAFLARPEAVATWGLLGIVVLVTAGRRLSPRLLTGAVLMGAGFVIVAAPYWVHIHDVTGRWSLTGRGVAPLSSLQPDGAGQGRGGPAGGIERMLWADDTRYEQLLYGLDASGLRLRSDYWGVYPEGAPALAAAEDGAPGPLPSPQTPAPAAPDAATPDAATPDAVPPSPWRLYFEALRQILPPLLWPLVILGALRPRQPGTRRREGIVAGAVIGTGVAIALLVAVDPRTQLLLVPLLAFYAARGIRLLDEVIGERSASAQLRPHFVEWVLTGVVLVWLAGINGQRLYRSTVLGSPHHIVAAQNRAVARELDQLATGHDGPVSSWHPAIAVFADRDWRVLPYATLPGIVRYADAAGTALIVLSAYYPPPLGVESLGTRYLVLPVPASVEGAQRWRLQLEQGDSIRALGRLEPSGAP